MSHQGTASRDAYFDNLRLFLMFIVVLCHGLETMRNAPLIIQTHTTVTDWAQYYKTWLQMGGEGPISFTEEDYFALFDFARIEQVRKLKRKLKDADPAPYQEKIARLEQALKDADPTPYQEKIARLEQALKDADPTPYQEKIARLEQALKDADPAPYQEQIRRMEQKYNAIRHSTSWRLTAPLRKAAAILKRKKKK
ncbi:MAG: hypothetical protein E7457_02160 [Ruminococcaceae bacterium]|nr:hypothetical protein [Oscillospiraceae bacterium]